jgi:basic membrane lipoprotein Med (substrate-binding protein (PBP1-ABC) superfamily)
MPVLHWGKYYELIVRQILDGTFDAKTVRKDESLNYWWGLSSGVIGVILSEDTPAQTQRLIRLLQRDIADGRLLPFESPLVSQKGTVLAGDGAALSTEEIITMDWLCENVVGEIPAVRALKEDAKETVSVSGVRETKGK